MPMLEGLKITEQMFERPTEVVVGDHIATLPLLRRLILMGNEFFCLGLPQHLSIPSTSSFVLVCTQALRRFPPDLPILPHSIPSSSGTDFDSVATTLDRIHVSLQYSSVLVEGWNLSTRSVSTLQFTSADIEPEADINLEFTPPRGKYDPMLFLLFKTLHLQQVRTIRLSFCSPCDAKTLPQSITDLLTMLPALESCVVERIFVGPFVKALNSSVGDDFGMSLTGLDELELMGHGFVEEAEDKVAANLWAYAAARDRMGGRMKVIRLRDCEDMDAMWLEELGRVVADTVQCGEIAPVHSHPSCREPSSSHRGEKLWFIAPTRVLHT
ncbi:uncharacterized protein STEHIDRAFT_152833 [Stereum hirsutum FP-91666 SS1]|uniref:uncharacterized protein n=1 Tax=Stereum hirsutum (strain FP-91666) TaxID=721885 RepID=UPI000440FD47|nr:uncharacterized protein STEHIDRAFT_152833 [Stereum hirsutum FP-91666 SS1]EIM91174.1 hypothetical protein STEHIDRAFT_152833 [Stereum hirsutum FP-91666 SS1]